MVQAKINRGRHTATIRLGATPSGPTSAHLHHRIVPKKDVKLQPTNQPCGRVAVVKAATVETSDNVLVDDLLNARRLDAANYVTDATQAWDFYWDRESGLRIRVGVHDVRVVPQYEDVDHSADGDNDYVLNNPNDDDDRRHFRDVVDSFCR